MPSPLAHYLANLRKAKDLPQATFGAPIGLAGSHVSIIERGKRHAPLLPNLLPLADFLELTPHEIAQLKLAASQSPRLFRISPGSPAAAFRLVEKLQSRWSSITAEEFERLSDFVESLGHTLDHNKQRRNK